MHPKKLDYENYDFEKDNQEAILSLLDDYYSEEGNPLYAWEAYAFCRKYERVTPFWVLSYFDRVAKELFELAEKKESSMERASALVYKALGMKRVHSRNVFDRYQIARRNRQIWSRVCYLKGQSRTKLTEAFDQVVSEMGSEGMEIPCDLAAVKKAYYGIEKEAHRFEVFEKPRRGPKRKSER